MAANISSTAAETRVTEGRLIQSKNGGDWGYKRYLDEMPGVPIQDLWPDIAAIQSVSHQGTGYATQNPKDFWNE